MDLSGYNDVVLQFAQRGTMWGANENRVEISNDGGLSWTTFFVNVENDKIWKAQLVKSAKEKGVPESVEFFNNALWLYTNNQKRINK